MEKVTIKDIAKICNVGVSTVSRAINNDPGINRETQKRILEVIQELNYKPNNSARNLKLMESNTIAVLVKGVDNPFFGSFMKYYEEEFSLLKYTFLLYAVRENENEMDVARQLVLERKLKGIIFLGGMIRSGEDERQKLGVPYVLCTSAYDKRDSDRCEISVSVDDEEAAYELINYLILKGHRRIMMVAGRRGDQSVATLRLNGYKRALRKHGIPFDPELIGFMREDITEYAAENGYLVTKDMLEAGVSFTAVFASSDTMALGAYKAITERGLSIPEDISVVGFDGLDMARFYTPTLTTMVQPVGEMARASVALLQKAIEEEKGEGVALFRAAFYEGDSVKDLRS